MPPIKTHKTRRWKQTSPYITRKSQANIPDKNTTKKMNRKEYTSAVVRQCEKAQNVRANGEIFTKIYGWKTGKTVSGVDAAGQTYDFQAENSGSFRWDSNGGNKMFSGLNTEDNVIKNMAKEIVRDSNQAGVVISVDVAVYLIHLKFLIPAYGYQENKTMNRNFTQPIIDECVRDFVEDSVWINTLKLQSYSENNIVNREVTKVEHDETAWKRWRPLMKEILDMDPSDKDSRDKMYKKIVLFTVINSGVGNPNFNSILREAQAALQSIFRYSDLDRFIFHPGAVKEEQLLEFSRIATGIRLFNKDCQKGGDGIDDLPLLLTQASQIRKERINSMLEQLMKRIIRLTSAFDIIYYLTKRKTQVLDINTKPNIPPEFTASDIDKMKRILCMIREHEYYLRKLLLIVEESMTSTANLIERFRETLLHLHDIVRYRSAVPTVQVYPLFIVLSHIWEEMQKEASILSDINTFMSYLQSFGKYEEPTPLELTLNSDGPPKNKDDTEPMSLDKLDRKQLHSGVTIVIHSEENLLNEAQFGGYCAWTLAAADGLLIPGNASIGFLRYNGRIYSFSSMLVAGEWGKNPDPFIVSVYKAARDRLELVKILNLYDELYKIKTNTLKEKKSEAIARRNIQIQTETHPVKSYIDRDYSFSLWEYRRRALQLSHIINYQTKSQQTVNHSHFRASIGLQTAPDASETTQTKRDNSCNHPLVSSYLMGLRRHYDDKFLVLDLTRPVDEGLQPENLFKTNPC